MIAERIIFESKDQNMWATGDALKLEWHEYFPLIGGDRIDWQIENASVAGKGIAFADGHEISFDPKDRYDGLADGATKTIVISYDLVAEGKTTKSETLTITATGTSSGTTFTVPDNVKFEDGKYTFIAVKAEDIMGNPHRFDTVTPIDINWDLIGELRELIEAASSTVEEKAAHQNSILHAAEENIAQLRDDIANLGKISLLMLKYEALGLAIEGSEVAEEALEHLENAVASLHLEKNAAEAAHAAKVGAVNAARLAEAAAEEALHLANEVLDGAVGAFNAAADAIGSVFSFFGVHSVDDEIIAAKNLAHAGVNFAHHELENAGHVLRHAEAEAEASLAHLEHVTDQAIVVAGQIATKAAEVAGDGITSFHDHLVEEQNEIGRQIEALATVSTEKREHLESLIDDERDHIGALGYDFQNMMQDYRNYVFSSEFQQDYINARLELSNLLDEDFPDFSPQEEFDRLYKEEAMFADSFNYSDWDNASRYLTPDFEGEFHIPFSSLIYFAGMENLAQLWDDMVDLDHKRYEAIDKIDSYIARIEAEPDAANFSLDQIAADILKFTTEVTKAVTDKSPLEVLANEAGYVKDQALEFIATGLEGSELKLTGKVEIDAHVQAGLQIDFVLDGGSVNSKIEYTLNTKITHRDKTDSVDLKLMLTNETTGDTVAFDTHSPSMQFYAGIVYDVGAKLSATFDMLAEIAGMTLFDVPGDKPITWEDEIRLSGWLDIFDYDSRTDASFEPPIPGLLGDILSVEFNFPSIETLGIEAVLKEEFYKDPAAFSLDGLAGKLLNLLDFDPHISNEFKAFLAKHELSDEVSGDDFVSTLKSILINAFDLLTAASDPTVDLNGDGVVPIFLLTKEGDDDALSDPLFHINTFTDVTENEGFDITKMGKFGFYMATGKSEPLVKVDVDVDQLIATIISAIAEGGVPEVVFNPFDIGFDASDIFGDDKKDDKKTDDKKDDEEEEEEEPDGPLTLDVGFEILDLHVSAEAGIEQKFGLSIDDMVFNVKLEGKKGAIVYKASDKNFNVHGSDFVDKNNDGIIDYTISITPDAQLFNDTEIAFKLGYVLDLLKAHAKLGLDLPISDIPGLSLLGIDPNFELNLGIGPIVRLEGELDALTADLFEDIFEYHAGSATTTGSFEVFGITLGGTKSADKHVGHHNDDVLKGGGGHDKLLGKNGDDKLLGGNGNDIIIGGGGNDRVTGGKGNDTINGGGGHDTLNGDAGNDVLKGGGGNDVLKGGGGNDKIIGGGGKDKIEGGAGDDILKGNGGSDVFVFNLSDGARTGNDKIFGFDKKTDSLQFIGISEIDVKKTAAGTIIDFDGGEILLQGKNIIESDLIIDFA